MLRTIPQKRISNEHKTRSESHTRSLPLQLPLGLSFLASRIAMDSAPVTVLLSHRFLLAFLLMSILLLSGRTDCHLRHKSLKPLLLLGFMQPVIYFIGEQYGILHSTTIFSGVMISIIPIAGILAAIPVLHEISEPHSTSQRTS